MASKGAISIDVVIKEGNDGLKKLTIDADGLRKIMEQNVEVASRLQSKVFKFAATTTGIKGVSSAFEQLSSTIRAITGESEQFEKAMRGANTMAGKDSAGFGQLKDEVADLAKEIPIARDQLANGLYQTISNGVPEDNWIEFLNTSARSAVGGMADINKVVGVTSTLIKNYGLEWSAAADIQDKIQLTAKNGVTSFEQLAQALPRVTGNAATLGVSIDELMGTFATLTGVSGNTAEVSTQLAAIFTALVKPSSEAAEMAARMGIQFDAAAIKAAGGFQNFLSQLDGSVKAYAQANGVLEQEVYGKLFGSAEAIRALIPLQGELADKFTSNVANMVSSVGTMDAAYADMSSTGEATTQMLRNQWAVFTDLIAGVTSAVQPYVDFGAQVLNAMASVAILSSALKQLNIASVGVVAKTALANVTLKILSVTSKGTALSINRLGSIMGLAAKQSVLLKIGLRGLLIATGVGAAIAAVTAIVEYFVNAADDATESVEELDDATDEYTRAAAAAKVQIEKDIKSLGDLIKAKKDTAEMVQYLNKTYGDIFGTYKTAAEWYDTLTQKSQLYIKQIGYEAQARELASKIAENSIDRDLAAQKKSEWERDNKDKMRAGRKDPVTGLTSMYSTDDEWKELDKAVKDIDDKGDQLQERMDVIGKRAKETSEEIRRGVANTNKEVAISAMNLDQVTAALDTNAKARKSTIDPKRTKELLKENGQLLARKKILEKSQGFAATSRGTHTTKKEETRLQEISAQREELKNKWLTASAAEKETIEEQIELLNVEKKAIEDARERLDKLGVEDKESGTKKLEYVGDPKTVEDYAKNVAWLDEQISKADKDTIAGLNQRRAAAQEALDALRNAGLGPVFKEDAATLKEIGANIAWLTDQLENATVEEAATLNKQIALWQGKADAIRNAGNAAEDTFGRMREGWGSLKGMADGIQGINDALEGNGNAWEKVTAIVDGFLSIYDSISAIVGVIEGFAAVTGVLTKSKKEEAAATVLSTGAELVGAATSDATAAAKLPVIAANEALTNSYMKLAAAEYYAAHASIPFAGFAIATGFIGASKGVIEGIGVTPFANGGIVSGPTVGLIGEYAGASNNPEVVAPLDKLRGMLNPVGEPVIVGGTLRASGRDIVCVLANETRIAGKSGKRTNIKL